MNNSWIRISPEEASTRPLYGVGGWLSLFVVLLVAEMGIGFWDVFVALRGQGVPLREFLTDGDSWALFPKLILGVMLVTTLIILAVVFRRAPSFRPMALSALVARGPLFAAAYLYTIRGEDGGANLLLLLGIWAVECLIWVTYLQRSQRVRLTYENLVKAGSSEDAASNSTGLRYVGDGIAVPITRTPYAEEHAGTPHIPDPDMPGTPVQAQDDTPVDFTIDEPVDSLHPSHAAPANMTRELVRDDHRVGLPMTDHPSDFERHHQPSDTELIDDVPPLPPSLRKKVITEGGMAATFDAMRDAAWTSPIPPDTEPPWKGPADWHAAARSSAEPAHDTFPELPDTAWQAALDEFENTSRHRGLWAKLFAQSGGNENRAKAQYLLTRAEAIARAQ